MNRTIATLILAGIGTAASACAFAQSSGKIPVQEDLRRQERLEQRLGERPDATGSTARAPVQSDPSGVAGFSGPPGTVGDSVGSYGALPPGAPGNETW